MRYAGTAATVLLLVVLSGLASGCKKKSSDATSGPSASGQAVVTAYEKTATAAVDAKLKLVEGLKGKLPATTTDGVTLDGKASSARWWVHDVDLANVEATPTGTRVKDAGDIRECAKEARHPDFGKHSIDRLGRCERTRYAFIVRTLSRTDPKVTEQAKGPQNGKFLGGSAIGDVVIYDLEAKKPIGGYRWQAGNDALVLDGKLVKDFEENIFAAIQNGYSKYVK